MGGIRPILTLAIAALFVAVSVPDASADECGARNVTCPHVSVPLDRSGVVPGSVSLHVEMRKPDGVSKGAIFLLAGGPGQASTRFFELSYWAVLFPHYTIVSFDPRGTGDSNRLSCGVAQAAATPSDHSQVLAGRCADELGPARAFYSTADNVQDLEAVRQALGFPKIGMYGGSYGTYLALAYTRTFPDRVDRLVLDSVATPLNPLSAIAEVLRRLPSTLDTYCARVCTGPTKHYASDAVRLANELEAHPLRVRLLSVRGDVTTTRIDGALFVALLIETDVNPGLAAELPAVVHAALGDDSKPLERLVKLLISGAGSADAVYIATSCDDGPFPWQPDTPLNQRPALLSAAAAGFGPGELGGFGSWALGDGNASMCLTWPTTTAPYAEVADGPYPDVPVLAVSGTLDVRTPTPLARAVLANFPHGTLITVANAGHAALASSSYSICLIEGVRKWIEGGKAPSNCKSDAVVPLAAFPARKARYSRPAQIVAAAQATVKEARITGLLAERVGLKTDVPGVAGGTLSFGSTGVELEGYRLVNDVSLSGDLTASSLHTHAIVDVSARGHVVGTLAMNDDTVEGTLDGKRVVAGRLVEPVHRTAPRGGSWSTWSPSSGSTADVAAAIASHVEGKYALDKTGAKFVDVRSGPPVVRGSGVKLAAVSVVSQVHLALDTWTYDLCGAGPRCSIPGKASVPRGTLVHREALELALDAFKFMPDIRTLVIYLPSLPDVKTRRAIYVERASLAAELQKPLRATLAPLDHLVPSSQTFAQSDRIYRLLPSEYSVKTVTLSDGKAELVFSY